MYRSLHPTLISLAAGYVFVAEKLVAAAQRMVLGVHLEGEEVGEEVQQQKMPVLQREWLLAQLGCDQHY